MIALLKYWREIIMVVVALASFVVIQNLRSKITTQEASIKVLNNELLMQSTIIKANKVEIEKNTKVAQAQTVRIQKEYVDRVKVIEKWRENNATCDDSIGYLNNYAF